MRRVILFLSLVILFAACNDESNKVKIIKNYDGNYRPAKIVDQAAGTEEQKEKMRADIKSIVGRAIEDCESPARVIILFRMYISETGKVDALMSRQVDDADFSVGEYTYLTNKDLLDDIAAAAASWEFSPAIRDGKPIKFREDIKGFFDVNSDGSVIEMQGDLESVIDSLRDSQSGAVSEDGYYIAVEEQPVPIGGLAGIQERIQYPEIAKRAGIEGKVFVKAYVDEDGKVVDAEVLKGIGAGCDEAALRAVRETKFFPGKQRGEPVKVQVSIPIVFKLQ